MNCKSIQEKLPEYLLRELNPSDDRQVNAHLRGGCAKCNAELADLQAAMEALLEAEGQQPLSDEQHAVRIQHAEILSNVISRGRKSNRIGLSSAAEVPTCPTASFSLVTLLYPLAFAAGLLLALYLWGGASSNVEFVGRPTYPTPAPNFDDSVNEARSTIFFTSLTSPKLPPTGVWQAVYDSFSRELHFFVRELPPPPKGNQWVLVTYNSAGEAEVLQTIKVDASGRQRAIIKDISLSEASKVEVVPQPIDFDALRDTKAAEPETLDA